MATTLVIKNADFSTNKIDTVVFDSVPCTGITINDASYSISNIGGTQIVSYSVTPLDTTDDVSWASSNNNIATVENGIITGVGIGTATITATCGGFSATCSVSVSETFSALWIVGRQCMKGGNSPYYISESNLSSAACCYIETGTYDYYDAQNSAQRNTGHYPYKMPNGAVKVRVQAQNCYIGIWWSDTHTADYQSFASVIDGNNASSTAGFADDYTYTLPDGANSFALTIRKKVGDMSQSDLANYTITFLSE